MKLLKKIMRTATNLIRNFILFLVTLIICYGLLIVGDYVISKLVTIQLEKDETYIEAKEIESIREIEEDIPSRKIAISDGLLPTVYPNSMNQLDLKYPLIAGLPSTETYFCNEGYGLIRYRSDRFGFRNKDSLWNENKKQLMIGDSFVQGACVSDGETLPQRLSDILKSNVINLGMGSNNPSHYFAYSVLFIPKFEPEIVYLNFYSNDYGVHKSIIEQKYVDQKIKIFSEKKDSFYDINIFKEEGYKAINLLNEGKTIESDLNFFERSYKSVIHRSTLPFIRSLFSLINDKSFASTEKAIVGTLDLCVQFNCQLIVSFIPNSNFYRPDSRADFYGDRIADLTKRLEIPFADGRKYINRERNSLDYAIKGPHLSPLGYRKMANAISYLVQ